MGVHLSPTRRKPLRGVGDKYLLWKGNQFLHVLVFDNGCTRSIIIWASPILLLPTLFAGWNTSYFYFLAWFSEVNEEKHHVNEGNSCQIRWMIDRIKTKCSPRWRIVWRWLLHFKFLFDRCYCSDLFLMWWCGFLNFNRSQFSSTLPWWVDWFCWDTVQYLDEAKFLITDEALHTEIGGWTMKSIDKLVE